MQHILSVELQLKILSISIYRKGLKQINMCLVTVIYTQIKKNEHTAQSNGDVWYSWISRLAGLRAGFKLLCTVWGCFNLSGIRFFYACARQGTPVKTLTQDFVLQRAEKQLSVLLHLASAFDSNLNKVFRPVHQKLSGLSWMGSGRPPRLYYNKAFYAT